MLGRPFRTRQWSAGEVLLWAGAIAALPFGHVKSRRYKYCPRRSNLSLFIVVVERCRPRVDRELSGRDMFSVNPKGNSLPNHSRTPSNSIPSHQRTSNSGSDHKRSGSSALGFLFPSSHVRGHNSGSKAEQHPTGVPLESAAAVVAAQTASAVIPTGMEQQGNFLNSGMPPHHLEEGLAGPDASDRPLSFKHPDTPPLLGGGSRRASLIHARNSKGEPPDTKSESDLMIGEIKVKKRVKRDHPLC